MIPPNALILLDTNVLVYLVRGKELGKRIDDEYRLRARAERPIICIVTIGEALALARKFGWGAKKVELLKDLMREFPVVDINSAPVLERYAELDHFSETNGRPIGQNDLWIAAAASATDAWLLTSDKDFDYLHENEKVKRERVQLATA